MAMIKCPECGHDVSDKAKSCPHCGFAVADNRSDGDIRVKLTYIYDYPQKVVISTSTGVLWEGHAGQTADFYLDKATTIHIKYYITKMMGANMECDGYIDPAKGKRYQIQQKAPGFFKPKICLNRVDVIDSD